MLMVNGNFLMVDGGCLVITGIHVLVLNGGESKKSLDRGILDVPEHGLQGQKGQERRSLGE